MERRKHPDPLLTLQKRIRNVADAITLVEGALRLERLGWVLTRFEESGENALLHFAEPSGANAR